MRHRVAAHHPISNRFLLCAFHGRLFFLQTHDRYYYMGILVGLQHITRYKYDRLINLGPQVIRLKPAPHCKTKICSYSFKLMPSNHFLNWQQDPFGNYLARAVFPEKVKSLEVIVDLVADYRIFNPFDFFLEDSAKLFPLVYEPCLKKELAPYLELADSSPELDAYVEAICPVKAVDLLNFLVEINQRLHQKLKYVIRLEPGVQSCQYTLREESGSCRDMAWLFCQILRRIGLASRFSSGYLIQLTPDVKSLDGPTGTDHDFTDLHAWTEVYLPGAGWVGFDPTSGLLAGEGHIPLCCTPNPSSAAPITGILDECESELEHVMTVQRIDETRRITKPYSLEDWIEINTVGRKIDKKLMENDVRLTMGGEPTFVAEDDRESPEWNVDALGEEKRRRAAKLLHRLKDKFSPKGLLLFSQGKWYPGELLPRWSFNCYWRKDNEPMCEFLSSRNEDENSSSYKLSDALDFLTCLTKYLGVSDKSILPAREDATYYLWKEGKIPIEGEILKADLFEKSERKRLQDLLDKGLHHPVGYVLPLQFSEKFEKWISNYWKFRNNHLILSPGDSPIGLRLPLGSLPNVNIESTPERSPFAMKQDLASFAKIKQLSKKRFSSIISPDDHYKNDPNGMVKTSLCVEIRNSKLYVFLPPVPLIEHFLDLICSVEHAAKEMGFHIVLEGYSPPNDLRISNFKITPDPGVIEVNIQPSKNWDELVSITETIYEEARFLKLSTEKFLINGQRVGTGGGNHIVVGGESPEDSPFLRRPDLLKSLITFWQNHPSLSYLFSSAFIGPTSQSPRIDEARQDSLYELEVALKRTPLSKSETAPFWLIDRLFRNTLIDVVGNTHRAEFCIDKLYNPEGQTGRLGLVELRNFEMPPHPKMSAVQSLLIRACIACFWEVPYNENLIRWGTLLHDKFMLPHYVHSDFLDVVKWLNNHAYELQAEWFEPFFEFRFPLIGKTSVVGIDIELRNALEPWHVLGEESYQGSVSRSVDSSVERIQIKVSGDIKKHQIFTCNQVQIPLCETSQRGEFVAGIRFKAWSPPSSLHPTIPIQSPLIFDVVDTQNERSLGGCTYYASHPGGRNFETIPVNENEAEGRRLARFDENGHTSGKMLRKSYMKNQDFPSTLDLRLFDELKTC